MSGNNHPRSFRERLALISGVDLEQLDGLETDESEEMFEFEPNLARLIIGLEQLEARDDNDEPLVGFGMLQDEFVGQVGLNETPLTKALIAGHFGLAENIILDNTDVEYLNDGVHTCTPLNLSLTGKSTFLQKRRNLKIARLLIENGANPNLRIPNHDLDMTLTVPESPLELLLQYYLDLLKTFKNDRVINGTVVLNIRCDDLDEDLLDTIGLFGEEKVTSEVLIVQTKQLLNMFLDRGGDVNLQSNQSGRTIFHVALCAEVTDHELIEKMIHLGALVNLTDVHGSTPYMDVLSRKNQTGGVSLYLRINNLGKRILLDAQNCSGESALWRSLYHGLLDCTHLLLHEGALSSTSARVIPVKPKRPSGRMRFFHRQTNVLSSLPAILAPILPDSPVYRSLGSNRFSVKQFNQALLKQVSPLVDDGWFCTSTVEQTIHDLIKTTTEFGHLTHNKVFQEFAIIPLLFGEVSAGLRQKCLRKIIYSVLFQDHPDAVLKSLLEMTKVKDVKKKTKKTAKKSIPQQGPTWVDLDSEEGPSDSACVVSSVLSDTTATTTDHAHHDISLTGMTLSEPEMRRSTSTPQPLRPRRLNRRRRVQQRNRVTTFESGLHRQIDDNWLLRQNPDYSEPVNRRRRRTAPRSLEGIEIEISREEEEVDEDLSTSGAAGPPTVVRIHRLLRQTNDMLERLQSDFDKSLRHDLATVQNDLQLSDSKSDTTDSDDQSKSKSAVANNDWQNYNSSAIWQGLQNDLALRGIDLLPMELTPSNPSLVKQQDRETEQPEINSNRILSAVENTELDEEGQLVDQLCQSVDAVLAKTESIILEAQIGRKPKSTAKEMDLETGGQELCDSLCSSADVIIAKTEAMVHQTHTELPAFSQSLNMCDVTSLIVKPSQTHTELPSFPQSLNMCDVIAHHTKPSVHHSVEVVPILSYERDLGPVKRSDLYCQSELSVKREDSGLERIRSQLEVLDEQEQEITSQLKDIDVSQKFIMDGIQSGFAVQSSSPGLSDISNPALGCHEELVTCHDETEVALCDDVNTLDPVKPSHAQTRPEFGGFPALQKLMQIYDKNDVNEDTDTSTSASEASSVFPRPKRVDSPMPAIDTSDSSLSFHSSDDEGSNFQPSPTDESWGGGPFSLRHTILAEARLRRCSNSLKSSMPATHESIIQRLDPTLATAMAKKIGIPPGLFSCFELEMARLQLCLAVSRHRVVECDRGCEGNDSNSSDDDENETSESGESSWEFGSLSGPFSSATGVDLSSSLGSDSSDDDQESGPPYEPSLPSKPRVLTSSSSENDDDSDSIDFRLQQDDDDDRTDWFSVVGDSEHASTSRLVQEKVDRNFNHSTDSDTEKSEDDDTPSRKGTLV